MFNCRNLRFYLDSPKSIYSKYTKTLLGLPAVKLGSNVFDFKFRFAFPGRLISH